MFLKIVADSRNVGKHNLARLENTTTHHLSLSRVRFLWLHYKGFQDDSPPLWANLSSQRRSLYPFVGCSSLSLIHRCHLSSPYCTKSTVHFCCVSKLLGSFSSQRRLFGSPAESSDSVSQLNQTRGTVSSIFKQTTAELSLVIHLPKVLVPPVVFAVVGCKTLLHDGPTRQNHPTHEQDLLRSNKRNTVLPPKIATFPPRQQMLLDKQRRLQRRKQALCDV